MSYRFAARARLRAQIPMTIPTFVAVLALCVAPTGAAAQRTLEEPPAPKEGIPAEAPDAVKPLGKLSPEQRKQLALAFEQIVDSLGGLGAAMPSVDLPSLAGPLPSLRLPDLDPAGLPAIPLAAGTRAAPGLPQVPGGPALPALPGAAQGLVGQVDGLLEAATFTWEAECDGRRSTHSGLLFVPTPIDVCGNLLPDVIATLTVAPGGGQMTVAKLPLASGSMALKLEAVLDDPRDSANGGAAFGYDAREATAPSTFTAALALTGAGDSTTVDLDISTSGAGSSLAVIGEAFRKGTGGERARPQRARLGYAPVPATASVSVRAGGESAAVTLGAASPTVATLRAEDHSGAGVRSVDARIDRLPGSLSVALAPAGGGSGVAYRSSAPVGRIEASLADSAANERLELELGGVPTEIDLTRPTATRTEIAANGPIGSAFAGAARGGSPLRRLDPAYVYAVSTTAKDSLAVRLLGLESAVFDTGTPTTFAATLAPGPFQAVVESGARRLTASVLDLPHTLSLSLNPATRRASYTGSHPIGEVSLHAGDPAGIAPRVTNLDLLLRAIPTRLDLDLGQSGDALGADARGAEVGLVEARLHDGTPALSLAADEDGLKLRDVTTDYEVLARVSGLRRVSVRQRPTPDFDLAVAGGRVFVADLRQSRSGLPDQTITGRIDRVARDTRIRLFEAPGAVRTLAYTAAQATNRIDLGATGLPLSGRATRADLVLVGIPTALTLQLGSEASSSVVLDAGTGLRSVSALLTSGPTTTLPEDGIRLIDTAAQYTLLGQVTNLRRIAVRQRPSVSLELGTAGGRPFRADLRQRQATGPDQTLFARVVNLPSQVNVGFAESSGSRRLTYSASAPVSSVVLNADNLPLSGRARFLRMTLTGLPTALTLDLGAEGGPVNLTTGGAALGQVDALLTSGPFEAVPAGQDGLVARDLPDRYLIAARISGLVRASAQQSPLSLFLDSTAGNPVLVRIDSQPAVGQKLTFTEARLSNLRRNTTVSLSDSGNRTRVNYSAAAQTGSLTLATNAGDRPRLDASLAPVPTGLGVCFAAENDGCAPGRPSNRASALLTSAQRTTVNLRDQGASKLTVTNLSLEKVQAAIRTAKNCNPFFCLPEGSAGSIFLDTDFRRLTGEIRADTGDVRLRAFFPGGFNSNDRFVRWTNFIPVEKSGSISCPSGTALDVTVFGITINVAGLYLC